jgi:hypothetical protein
MRYFLFAEDIRLGLTARHGSTPGWLVEAGSPEHHVPIEIRLFRPVSRQSETAEAVWAAFL